MELMESGKTEQQMQHFLTLPVLVFLTLGASKLERNKLRGPPMVIVGKFRELSSLDTPSFRSITLKILRCLGTAQ